MSQSALFAVVPEAEPWVGNLRSRYDPSAQVGVPAHISVLFPFMPRESVTEVVLKRLRAVFHNFAPFAADGANGIAAHRERAISLCTRGALQPSARRR